MKFCHDSECKQLNPQSLENFNKDRHSSDGLKYNCRVCDRNRRKQWYNRHKDVSKRNNKKWSQKNPEKVALYQKKCTQRHLQKRLTYWKEYYIKNRLRKNENYKVYRNRPGIKEKANKRSIQKRKDDPNFRLAGLIRQRLYDFFHGYTSNPSGVDCTREEFLTHISKQFEPGMTWDNYGRGKNKWCFDHIISLRLFDLTIPEEYARAAHYTNVRPLWYINNISKR